MNSTGQASWAVALAVLPITLMFVGGLKVVRSAMSARHSLWTLIKNFLGVLQPMINIKVIDLDGREQELQAEPDTVLMELLREQDWGVAALCGGMCSCATCHVFLDETWLDRFPMKESDEEELLELLDHFQPNSRLSCQLRLQAEHDGLTLTLAPEE